MSPVPNLSMVKRFWIMLRFWKRDPGHQHAKRVHKRSAVPFDLDTIEETMNRRMRTIWLRYATFLSILGFIAVAGLVALTVYLTTKATVMKMAVGPEGSRDVEFVEKLAEKFRSDRAPIRIQPVMTPGAVALADIHGKAPFDLAVVRGNLDLSTDWPVVAILRQDVVVLIVPAPDAYAPKRGRKHGKIEKVSELVGKRVGIVDSTDGGADLLNVILKHYGVPADKVKVVNVAQQDLKKAIHDDLIDVVLVAGPETGDAIAQAVSAASAGKEGPSFIEIDQAEGIGKRLPPYESEDIVAGAFGGVPPEPDDELTTLKYPIYIVARKTLSEDKVATFAKLLYQDRQSLTYQLPGTVAISVAVDRQGRRRAGASGRRRLPGRQHQDVLRQVRRRYLLWPADLPDHRLRDRRRRQLFPGRQEHPAHPSASPSAAAHQAGAYRAIDRRTRTVAG